MGGRWRQMWKSFVDALRRGKKAGEDELSVAPVPHRWGYKADELITALRHPNPDVRAGAARQLGTLHELPDGRNNASAVVAALIGGLHDEDAGVRSSAALSLGEWGTEATGAIPALIGLLAEEDDDVRSSAGIALEDIGEAARVPLQEALSHPDERVKAEAKAILTLMDGLSSEKAFPDD